MTKRILCLLLLCVLMISAFSFQGSALEQEAASASTLETIAVNYITTATATVGAYDRSYNKENAVAYAFTYTVGTYNNTPNGNNSSYLNSYFNDYTNNGGNCQNFVSQCLWAGFGGSNSSSGVSSKKFPMDTTGSGYYAWAYDLSGPWTATDPMRRYYANSNSSSETTGMITNYVSDSENEYTNSFNNYSGTTASMVGAPLYVGKNSAGYAHVVLIAGAEGKNFSQVYFCGNSPMRKWKKLSDDYSGTVCLVIPSAMKNGRGCSHSFTTSSGMSINYCRFCRYNRLKVTGNMLRPIAQNSTQTVGGSVNTSCYRMALCITTPSGNSTWIEKLSTSSISTSYTFKETGLYTVQVVARDKNSDTYPNDSVTAEQTFKIRVY